MRIDVLTLFPGMFEGFSSTSMVARAQKHKALKLRYVDIRRFSDNKHHKVDDYPYGGFPGMVMQAKPVWSAIESCIRKRSAPVIYFTPHGRVLTQDILEHYSKMKHIVLLCGHYKDVDQRVRDLAVSDEISIGDYVLSGGELAAMVFIDGVSRLIPGVLSDIASAESDSHSNGKLGFPCYSRPESFMGLSVPEVLRQGDPRKINQWAEQESDRLTRSRRPDLIKK